ncbi:MAG: hypothetical protein ACE3L7_32360 [Candidatus Pristimantibacillus sp.]
MTIFLWAYFVAALMYACKGTLVVHELGHYIVLKYIYRDPDCGIIIGDIHGELRTEKIIAGVQVKFFSKSENKKVHGTKGICYPWNEVYAKPKSWKAKVYAIAGAGMEFIMASLLITIGLFIIHAHTTSPWIELITTIVMIILIFMSILIPCLKLWTGSNQAVQLKNNTVKSLTKTAYGQSDRMLLCKNGKALLILYTLGAGLVFYLVFVTMIRSLEGVLNFWMFV